MARIFVVQMDRRAVSPRGETTLADLALKISAASNTNDRGVSVDDQQPWSTSNITPLWHQGRSAYLPDVSTKHLFRYCLLNWPHFYLTLQLLANSLCALLHA